MTKKQIIFSWLMMGCDWALLVLCFNLAYWIKFDIGLFPPKPHPYLPYLNYSIIVGIYGVIMLHIEGLYRIKGPIYKIESFFKIVKAVLLTFALSILTNFLFQGTTITGGVISFSRWVFVIFGVLSIGFIFVGHEIYKDIVVYFRKRGLGLIRLLIVGTGENEKQLYKKIINNPQYGYNPLGFITDEKKFTSELFSGKILGTIKDIRRIITKYKIEEVTLSNPSIPKEKVLEIKSICENLGSSLAIIPNIYGLSTVPARIDSIDGLTLFTIEERMLWRWNKVTKRIMDFCLASMLLLILSPLLLLIAIAIKIDSRGSVIFRQVRIGCGEKHFFMYKFRTMVINAEKHIDVIRKLNEADGPIFKMKNDPRITRVGKILRKYSIDELPQLWNVIKGDMSLVGPRPCLPNEAIHFKPYSYSRFNVKPGITGFAQVNGRSDIIFDKRCELDIYYMENWSVMMDITLLLKTIPIVFSGRGSY